MAKSRKRKGHAARVANRNAEKQHQKNRQQKEINKMIEQYKTLLEQEAKSTLGIENTEDTTGLTHIDGQKDLPHSKEYWSPDGDIIDTVIPESEDTK